MKTLSAPNDTFETASKEMIGWRLSGVVYTEGDLFPAHPQPCYHTANNRYHSVDFSVMLRSEDNQFAEIFWSENQSGFALKIHLNEKNHYKGGRTWNTTTENLWQPVIGKTISDVQVYRTGNSKNKKNEKPRLPFVLALRFSNNQTVYIGATEFTGSEPSPEIANNLLVTTDEKIISKNLFAGPRDEAERMVSPLLVNNHYHQRTYAPGHRILNRMLYSLGIH